MKTVDVKTLSESEKIAIIEDPESYYCVDCLDNTIIQSDCVANVIQTDVTIQEINILRVDKVCCRHCEQTVFVHIGDYEEECIRKNRIDDMIESIKEIMEEDIVDLNIINDMLVALENAK